MLLRSHSRELERMADSGNFKLERVSKIVNVYQRYYDTPYYKNLYGVAEPVRDLVWMLKVLYSDDMLYYLMENHTAMMAEVYSTSTVREMWCIIPPHIIQVLEDFKPIFFSYASFMR